MTTELKDARERLDELYTDLCSAFKRVQVAYQVSRCDHRTRSQLDAFTRVLVHFDRKVEALDKLEDAADMPASAERCEHLIARRADGSYFCSRCRRVGDLRDDDGMIEWRRAETVTAAGQYVEPQLQIAK